MPRLRFRRDDLTLLVEHDRVFVTVGGRAAQKLPSGSARVVLSALARSSAWKRWSAIPRPSKWPVIPLRRIVLDIRDETLAGEPWEREFIRRFKLVGAVVRTSPVRPRCDSASFTLPLRILEVNGEADPLAAQSVQAVFGRKQPSDYAMGVRVAAGAWPTWSAARLDSDWPGTDVLHIHRLPRREGRGRDLLSGDARQEGSLGWIAEKCVEWRVRLLILCQSPGWPLGDLRRLASSLVGRGGPAVVVDGFRRARPRPPRAVVQFYRALYEQMIHDYPVDYAWAMAVQQVRADPFDASLWVGAGREDQLRPSVMGRKLFKFLDAKNAPARRAALRVFEKTAARGSRPRPRFRPKGAPSDVGAARRVDTELSGIRQVWRGARFDLHESEGMLPLGRVLERARRAVERRPTLGELIAAQAPPRRARERYVNCSFSVERDGRLEELSQDRGVFVKGRIHHLGVQVGPRTGRVLTVGETALVEEPFQPAEGADGVWIEIGVTGIDVDVIGDPVQRVWLPQDKERATEVVYFAVRPRQAGVNRLRVALYYEQNVMQSFRIGVVAGRVRDRAGALARSLDIKRRSSADVSFLPVLEFSLASSIDGFARQPSRTRPALAIIANEWSGDAVITVKSASDFKVSISARLAGSVQLLQKALLSVSRLDAPNQRYPFAADGSASVAQLETALRLLADHGRELFVELFDSTAWEGLERDLAGADRTIQVANVLREKVIPWALVYDRELMPRPGDRDPQGKLVGAPVCLAALPDAAGTLAARECGTSAQCLLQSTPGLQPEAVVCPLHFWGFRHAIECPPEQRQESQGQGGRSSASSRGAISEIPTGGQPVAMVPGVNGEFTAEADHFAAIAKLQTKHPLASFQKQYTAAGLMRQMETSPLHIAYLFCHAEGAAGVTRSSVILQAPNSTTTERIYSQEFAGLFTRRGRKKWDPPALVFLNACGTANYSPEAVSPFLRSFVDQLGASGLVGTEIAVWDLFAAEMGKAFFQAFLDGKGAGPALLEARRVLLSRRNPLGLVYTLHASADLHLS